MTLSAIEHPPHEDSPDIAHEKEDTLAKFIIGCSDEEIGEDEDEEQEILRIDPPDGGWGWVVVAASFFCNAIVDGVIFTVGILFPKLKETFNASNSDVAWISSLLSGFYLVGGPFVSALANALGFRLVCLLGAIIGSVSCVISYFATNIYFLYISYGVFGGIGLGMVYVPAVVSAGFYFERKRALATGIAVCGSGIGTFVMSPLNTYLITNLGSQWKAVFFVHAAIILCCGFFGLAFRPLSAATGKKQMRNEEEIPGTPLLMRIKKLRDKELAQCPSALSMYSTYSRTPSKATLEEQYSVNGDVKPLSMGRALLDRHGCSMKHFSYPGIVITTPAPEPILEESENITHDDGEAKIFSSIPAIHANSNKCESSFIIPQHGDEENGANHVMSGKINDNSEKFCNHTSSETVCANENFNSTCNARDNNNILCNSRIEYDKTSDNKKSLKLSLNCNEASDLSKDIKIENSLHLEIQPSVQCNERDDTINMKSLDDSRDPAMENRNSCILRNKNSNSLLSTHGDLDGKYLRIMSAPNFNCRPNSFCSDKQRRSSKGSLRMEICRPFYRDDIFYSGSLARIQQYLSSSNIDEYRASVIHLPPFEVDNEVYKGRCLSCGVAVKYVLAKIFDFSLLSSITFIMLALSGFLALTSLFVPFIFLPSYVEDMGFNEGDTSFLLSLIGICNTAGRIIAGWISDHPQVDALVVNNLALIIGGIATVLLPSLVDISLLYCYAIVFGLSLAAFASLRSILLVELMGLEKLTNSFGLLLLFQGIAAAFGSPIAGILADLTGKYEVSFHVFGTIFALAGVFCIPLRMIKKWEDKRLDDKLRREKYGI